METDEPKTPELDRRGFLKCMVWVGTGVIWSLSSSGITSAVLGDALAGPGATGGTFTFAQVSDSHIGFHKPANPDVTGTYQQAISKSKRSGPISWFTLAI